VGGQFYQDDPTCASERTCDIGCCIVGLDSSRMLRGKCAAETQRLGFSAINFVQTDEDCGSLITSQDAGACITINNYAQKTCRFIPRTQCLGEFFPNVICSDVTNSPCNKTTNTVCFNNNVYYVDSCGNRDALKDSCDYNNGRVCRVISEQGKDVAQCQDSNCIDNYDFNKYVVNSLYVNPPRYSGPKTKKQGEVWCVTEGNVPFSLDNLKRDFSSIPSGGSGSVATRTTVPVVTREQIVGSLSAGGYSAKEIESVLNGTYTSDQVREIMTQDGYSTSDINLFLQQLSDFKANTTVVLIGWGSSTSNFNTIDAVAGLRFFSRTCIDGQIVTEPCEDVKEGYCSGSSFWSEPNSTIGTGGTCRVNQWRDCLAAEDSYDCDPANCFWYTPTINGYSSTEVNDLKIPKCLPLIPGGILDSNSRSSICEEGTYESSLAMNEFNAPLYFNVSYVPQAMAKGTISFMPFNPNLKPYFEYRCIRVADCNRKQNWLGVEGNASNNEIEMMSQDKINTELHKIVVGKAGRVVNIDYLSKHSGISLESYPYLPVYFPSQVSNSFQYKCVPWKPPQTGDCTQCEADGTTCTEYKCQSIGKNCQYYEQGGKNGGGTCMLKTDFIPPVINVNCPDSSTIKAQQPITISVNTSETSSCRYNVGAATATYDSMQFDLGATWGQRHSTILAVPGMNTLRVGNTTQYPLLIRAGNYSVFIRCIDPAGNGDATPAQLCTFNVPKAPDNNPSVILKFDPATNSPIKYNSSTAEVNLLVNEPVECKWDTKEKDFDVMNYTFSCGKELLFANDVSGYGCKTVMTNISKVLGSKTTFYVRCKDQPELEGNETLEYHRNKQMSSNVYVLTASDKLSITELSPQNKLVVGKSFTNWTLTTRTAGGGYQGEADCKWKLNYKNMTNAFSLFSNTGGILHTQIINQVAEGDYVLSVKCEDKAGNIANSSGPFQIRYDLDSPKIERVYNDKGYVKIITNELSICKFTNSFGLGFGCGFDFNDINLTLMTSSNSLSHNANWKKGANYLIKCRDFYGNENGYCGIIAKFV
jgi:hypothetical protein